MKPCRLALIAGFASLASVTAFASPITFGINETSSGSIAATTSDSESPPGGDNIAVSPGVSVTSTGGNITLDAADNITLGSGSTLAAPSGNIFLNFDQAPTDSSSDAITLGGSLNALGVTVMGGADSNILD